MIIRDRVELRAFVSLIVSRAVTLQGSFDVSYATPSGSWRDSGDPSGPLAPLLGMCGLWSMKQIPIFTDIP